MVRLAQTSWPGPVAGRGLGEWGGFGVAASVLHPPISVSPGRGYPAPGSDTAKAESQEVLPVGILHDLGTCRKSSQGLAFVLGPKSQTQGK